MPLLMPGVTISTIDNLAFDNLGHSSKIDLDNYFCDYYIDNIIPVWSNCSTAGANSGFYNSKVLKFWFD